MIDLPRLHAALTRFIEATQADKRDRALSKDAKALAADLGAAFDKQGKLFLAGFEKFSGEFGEAAIAEQLKYSDWIKTLTKAQKATLEAMVGPLEEAIWHAMIFGADALNDVIDWRPDQDDIVSVSLNVVNEEAVKYANRIAAERVTGINDVTKERMRSLIGNATQEGWSYGRLTKEITGRFNEYSSSRARRIAVFELRDAYEGGQRELVEQVQKRGLDMETYWLTAGDDRVRDSHRASQGEGWQDVGYTFAAGSDRPPTDPGCRCTALYRRKK